MLNYLKNYTMNMSNDTYTYSTKLQCLLKKKKKKDKTTMIKFYFIFTAKTRIITSLLLCFKRVCFNYIRRYTWSQIAINPSNSNLTSTIS